MILTSTDDRAKARDARRETFVLTARDEFISHGYGGSSMSAIAAKVGGSKTTLWTYFPSKQELFAAVLDDLVERYGRALEVALVPHAAIDAGLRRFARALLETLHSQPVIDMHRMTIGEAGRFPELGRMMFERGQARGKSRLSHYLLDAMSLRKLRSGDPALAARQFIGLVQSGSVQLHLLGLGGAPDTAALDQEAAEIADTFMRGWASKRDQ